MKNKKRVSLVLGSGGARGYAHIGVIEELEQRGYEIVSISGASMGALIGGFYACGKLQEYKEWVLDLDVFELSSLLDFSFDSAGLIKGEKLFDKLSEFVGRVDIESLPIPLTIVATDIINKKEKWFQSGDLLEAIRASISIPTFFTPVKKDAMILADGGILNPLPVAPTMSDKSDLIIAVNLYADTPIPIIKKSKEEEKRVIRLTKLFYSMFQKQFSENKSLSMLDVLDKTFDTMQYTLTNYRLGGYPPDILIDIPKDVCNTYDFHKAKEVIKVGRVIAKEKLSI